MKAVNFLSIVVGSLLLGIPAIAQNYSIDWYKIAGGGSSSSGGVYSLSGTIGQHDAGGPMTGGSYSLTGGFWALVAVQTPGAPLLTVSMTKTNTVLISWPSPSTGFILQQNSSVQSAGSWVTVPGVPADDGTTKSVVVSPPAGNVFYRLKN